MTGEEIDWLNRPHPSDGKTALIRAIESRGPDSEAIAIDLIQERWVNTDAPDREGRKPVDVARVLGKTTVLREMGEVYAAASPVVDSRNLKPAEGPGKPAVAPRSGVGVGIDIQ